MSGDNHDPELNAMALIAQAFNELDDQKARDRVLRWAAAKYADLSQSTHVSVPTHLSLPLIENSATDVETTGPDIDLRRVCKLMDSGDLRVTLRDLKAKSANDAAIRLAHIVIYCYQALSKQTSTSSRHVLTPELKRWRLYNGNSRHSLAMQKGIIREQDSLSLDAHATLDAERFIREALDPTIEGKWRP
jgi:hypothetical protein